MARLRRIGPSSDRAPTPTYTHTGHRFVLGFTQDVYAIWDREHPAEPVERFPRTDESWPHAWARYRELEPTAEAAGTPRPAWVRKLPVRSVAPLGTALTILLGLIVPASLLHAIARIPQIRLIDRILDGDTVPRAEALAADRRVAVAAGIVALLTLATIPTWLVWQHRGQRNLWATNVPGLRFTPGWAVGWWFIPFANLVQGPRAVRELRLASEPGTQDTDWRRARTPVAIVLWWGALLIQALVSFYVWIGPAEALERVRVMAHAQMRGGFAAVVAAPLAIWVVRSITARNEARVRRAEGPAGGPAPVAGDEPAFTHSGAGHVLGSHRGEYVIWTRSHRHEPAERFPGTSEGWDRAWARFRKLEPTWAAVTPAGEEPEPPPP